MVSSFRASDAQKPTPTNLEDGFELGASLAIDALDEDIVCAVVERRLFGSTHRDTRVGRYLLLEAIGAGTFGIVYKAKDPELDREVALKILRDVEFDRDVTQTLLGEARAMARLAHPNVMRVYDAGVTEGRVFVAMELVEGTTVRTWLGLAKRRWSEVLDVFVRAGRGLAAAHAANILHRDFKPDNVLISTATGGLTDESRVKVTDFGLALARYDDRLEVDSGLAGTPGYIAPEQLLDHGVDTRSDQFAFCASLWEALHGVHPFDASSVDAFLQSVDRGPRASTEAAVPRWLCRIVRRGLRADPRQRFDSIEALLAAIAYARRRRKRFVYVSGAGLMVALTAAIGYRTGARNSADPCEEAAAEVTKAWNASDAAAVRDAFSQTSVAFAAASADNVIRALDDWGRNWSLRYRNLCAMEKALGKDEATLDGRARCLEQRLEDIVLIVRELVAVDAAAVERAHTIVSRLPSLSSCDRPWPMIGEVGDREVYTAMAAELARVLPLRLKGELDEAVQIAGHVAARASALGNAALEAEALQVLGDLESDLGRFDAGVHSLERAYWRAEAAGADHAAVEIAGMLVFRMGFHKADVDAADRWYEHANAKLTRIDRPRNLDVALQLDRGAVAFVEGDFERALELLDGAITTFRATSDEDRAADELSLAKALSNRASVYLALDEYAAASEDFEQALEVHIRHLGHEHPRTAMAIANLGNLAYAMGDFEQAEARFSRARAIFEQAPIPKRFEIATCDNNLGNVARARGRLTESVAHHRRALETRKRMLGPIHPDVAQSLDNLGLALHDAGDAQTAVALHRRSLAIRRAAFGDRHFSLAYAHHGLGRSLAALGARQRAIDHLSAAITIRRHAAGGSALELAEALFDLARVLDENADFRGRADDAGRLAAALVMLAPQAASARLREEITTWFEGRSH